MDLNSPAGSGSPGLGDNFIREIQEDLIDLFGIPNAVNITGPIATMGSNTDGKLATLPVVKAASPFQRFIGTEVSAKDVRIVEDGGFVKIQENTGTEATPTWTTRASFAMSAAGDFLLEAGDLAWKSGTAFKGSLRHSASADRTYDFQDASGVVAFVGGNDSFAAGTRMIFDQDTAPTGWTRDASVNDRVINIQGSGNRVHGGGWPITGGVVNSHTHDMGNHTHGISHTHDLAEGGATEVTDQPNFVFKQSGFLKTATAGGGPPQQTALHTTGEPSSGNSSGPSTNTSGAAAPGVTFDGTWRPLHRSTILASKN